MDTLDVTLAMAPSWLLGIIILCVVGFTKYKSILRIDWAAILKWIIMLTTCSILRILFLIYFNFIDSLLNQLLTISEIPIVVLPMVFWEDACFVLPLLILDRLLANTPVAKVIFFAAAIISSVIFGLGHLYQGFFAVALLFLYVPLAFQLGKRYGLGTIMLGHVSYDVVTFMSSIIFLRYFI